MRVRTFRVPFSRVVADDAHEVEYGAEDFMVARPLFGLPAGEAQEWSKRIVTVREDANTAAETGDAETIDAAANAAEQLVIDILAKCVERWSLEGPDGPIPMPVIPADLNRLPYALRDGLFPFFLRWRGDAPNPTSSG